MTQREIAAKYSTTQKVVWRAMTKFDLKTRKATHRDETGKRNPCWRGGRIRFGIRKHQPKGREYFGNGYFYLKVPNHPNADKRGYVAEHTLVATQARGRHLSPDEVVHHINLHKHDNRLDNLIICTDLQHLQYHAQLGLIGAMLLDAGYVTFSGDEGYAMTPEFLRLIKK